MMQVSPFFSCLLMRGFSLFVGSALCGLIWLADNIAADPVALSFDEPPSNAEGITYFEKHIRPLFASQCQSCHGPNKHKGDLRLDQPEGIRKGGDLGPIIQAGKPTESLLLKALSYEDDDLKMPPRGKLSAEQIDHVRHWIALGAPLPAEKKAESSTPAPSSVFDLPARLKHWCYQPIQSVTIPSVKNTKWPISAIDSFVLSKLENTGLQPAPEVEKAAWLRRVTFDLIGLPPTPEEIVAFESDPGSGAYAKVVDRLLASPRYGERWARHWLDLVRYADTLGHEFDFDLPNSWRYRNYIIRALNDDVPYNQLVLEHFAGDLLPQPRINTKEQWNESIHGTAFLWFGEAKQAPVDVRQEQADRIDNQIDVLGKAFLGQTLACARCHDHKFDAIATRDYYALYGVLKSSRYQQACIDLPTRSAEAVKAIQVAKKSLQEILAKHWQHELQQFTEYLISKSTEHPPPKDFSQEKLQRWNHVLNDPAIKQPDHPFYTLGQHLTPTVAAVSVPKLNRTDIEINLDQAKPQGLAWLKQALSISWNIAVQTSATRTDIRIIPNNVLDSGCLSQRAEGSQQTQTFSIDHPYLHIRAAGQGGRLKVVVDGFEIIREPIYGGLRRVLKNNKLQWHTFDLRMWQGRHAYVEALAGTPNDLGVEEKRTPNAWLQLEKIFLSSEAAPPPIPQSQPDSLLAWMRQCNLLTIPEQDPTWIEAVAKYQQAESQLPPSRFTLATTDGNGLDEVVFTRGNHKLPGPQVPRGLSTVYCGLEPLQTGSGSGRLALVQRLIDPNRNPLIARVIVNRVWKHHFGEGLVKSVDDFGRMGELPSHPELLDYLAHRFVRDGWSLKKLHREMVLSRTYRQSSRNDDPKIARLDPQGRLLSHLPLLRLEAETIRDAMLAVSGQLKLEPREAGVLPYLTPLMQGRGRPPVTGPLDGEGRRSIYLSVRRNFLPSLLTAFDFPTPFSTMGRRSISNVPSQDLALMNDPFVIDQAQHWAKKTLAEDKSVEARLEKMYLLAFARKPTSDERKLSLLFLEQQLQTNQLSETQAWADLSHALICTKEFIFIP